MSGQFGTSALYLPNPHDMFQMSKRASLVFLFAILGIAGGFASVAMPLPLLVVAILVLICAMLSPSTPLVMLVIMLTLAPLRTLIATESNLALPLDIGQILLLLYIGVWLADRVRQRKAILVARGNLPLVAALALLAVLALGAWNSAALSYWLAEWLKWAAIALLIWTLSESVDDLWRWLVFAVLVSAVANALVGLFIFFGGSGADHLVIMGRYFRAFGTFGQPNPFGGFMGIALPIGLMTAYSQLQTIVSCWRARKLAPLAAVLIFTASSLASLLIIAALVASWSRGAWLGTAVACLVMMVAAPKKLTRGLVMTGGIAVLFAATWSAGLLPPSIVNRLTATASELVTISDVRGVEISPSNYAVIERLAHWQAAINMAADSPLFGVGLANYEVVYDDYRLINWEEPLGHAHNLYLNLLAEAGLVGLIAYLAFWIVIFRITWSLRRQPDEFARSIAIGLLGCWSYIAVHSVFDNLYVNNLFLHIGVLLSVLAILYRRTTRALELE